MSVSVSGWGRGPGVVLTLLMALAATGCGGGEPVAETRPKAETTAKSEPVFEEEEEEAQSDDLQVQGLRGHLDRDQIDAGVQPHREALFGCYRQSLKRRRFLGGAVEFKFKVAPDGAVKEVFLSRSDLGSYEVEECLLGIARSMSFAEPTGGADADFDLPLEFSGARGRIQWVDAGFAEEQVEEHRKELRACRARRRKDRVPAMVTLYVGRRGKVKSIGFSSPAERPVTDDWKECAHPIILEWVLEDPRGKIAKLRFEVE